MAPPYSSSYASSNSRVVLKDVFGERTLTPFFRNLLLLTNKLRSPREKEVDLPLRRVDMEPGLWMRNQ